jgi:hypothetical protein
MTATLADLLRAHPAPPVPVRVRAARAVRAAAGAVRRHRADLTLLTPLLAAATYVHVRSMYVTPARFDDEGTYVAQAWAVQQGRGLAHYTYWYDHPPLGWIQLAFLDWVVHPLAAAPNAVAGGRAVMLLFKLALCVALYVLARRLGMRRVTATGAVALLALSPLAVLYQRMVYLDNIEAFWIVAAFAVAARRSLTIGGAALSAVLFGVGVLSKETGLLLLPALALLVWQRLEPEIRRFGAVVFPLVSVLVVGVYPLLAILRRELFPGDGHVSLWEGVAFQLWERPSNGPLWDAGTVANGHVQEWLSLDPLMAIGGALVAAPALFFRHLRPIAVAIAIQVLVPLRGGYLPGPYLIMVLPFAALALAGVAEKVFDGAAKLRIARRTVTGALVVALGCGVVAAAVDWRPEYSERLFDAKDGGMTSAQAWVEGNVERDATIVVDDSIWVDLVDAGFDPAGVIWFWKLDDPDVELEGGWRAVDYAVLSSAYDGCTQPQCVKVVDIIDHSEVVGRWGEGVDSMTVYRVEK